MERICEYCITLNAGILTAEHADFTYFSPTQSKSLSHLLLCLSDCVLHQSAHQLKVQQKSSEVNKMRHL